MSAEKMAVLSSDFLRGLTLSSNPQVDSLTIVSAVFHGPVKACGLNAVKSISVNVVKGGMTGVAVISGSSERVKGASSSLLKVNDSADVTIASQSSSLLVNVYVSGAGQDKVVII